MDIGTLGLVTISDLKAIELAELRLQENGQFVALEGDNGVGKSTVMDAIEILFNGGRLPDGIIRKGKKEAVIEAQFSGGYSAKRRIRTTKKGDQVVELTLEDPTGAPVPSPGKVLKDLFEGFITPAGMAHSTGASLHYTACQMIGVDDQDLGSALMSAEERQREANAVVKAQGEREKPIEPKPDITPFDQKYYDEMTDVRSELREKLLDMDHKKDQVRQLKRQIEKMKLEVDMLETHLLEYDRTAEELEKVEEYCAGAKEDRDKRAHAEHLLQEWERYEDWLQGMNSATEKATKAKAAVDIIRRDIRELYAKAQGPGGVTVTEDRKVLINGELWENCAFSDRMKAATLMMLGSMPEDKIPLVFIEHGETMNSAKRLEIAAEAIKQGATVFMEIFKEEKKELTIRMEQGDMANLPSRSAIQAPVVEEAAKVLDGPGQDLEGLTPTDNAPPDYGQPPEIELF
jgi:chromosome segregation ATPase